MADVNEQLSGIALLLIDLQQGLVDAQPYQWPQVCDHIQQLLADARRLGIPVIHVQHQSPPDTMLEAFAADKDE